MIDDPRWFRAWRNAAFQRFPELFPAGFGQGFPRKDRWTSKKRQQPVRRIPLRDGVAYEVRPSCVMPSMTARVDDVEKPLCLRKFGVPLWALTPGYRPRPMSHVPFRLSWSWRWPGFLPEQKF